MREIEKKQIKYKNIENGYSYIKIYETEDGKQFINKREAEDHEYDLDFEKIKKVETSTNIPEMQYPIWRRPETEKEVELVTSRYNKYGMTLTIGEWFTIEYDYNGDYHQYIWFSEVREKYKKLCDELEESYV